MRFCDGTMLIWMRQFNLNFDADSFCAKNTKKRDGKSNSFARFAPFARLFCLSKVPTYLAAILVVGLLCGCQTDKKSKALAAIRIHIEVTVPTATSQSVSVLRSTPVLVTILKEPVLTEANVLAARLIETPGGYAVQLKFDDDTGSWILQQYSAANPGKHFVIFGQWGDKPTDGRWLAAPLITHRIPDGMLTFTPDASRQEAEQLVNGLDNVSRRRHGIPSKTTR